MIRPMRSLRLPLIPLLLTSVWACSPAPAEDRPWELASLPSPAGDASSLPQLSSSGDSAILSWVERAGRTATLKFATRERAGWSAPRTVASGDDWFVNWADVPSVIRLEGGTLAAHWLQKSGPGTYAYDVRLAFSRDGGESWSPAVTPHHDGTQTEHGFASLFKTPGAGLGLVWLDGRNIGGGEEAGHGGHGGGAMTLRAGTFDPAGAQTAEVELDNRVCECCPTAIAVTADGPIAAYRNRTDDEVRDIYVTRLVKGAWTEGVPVHADNWRIPACPVNGPGLAARGRRVALAWFTMPEGSGRAFVAISEDSGATFGAPIRVDDDGTLGRVDVELLDDGSAAVSWIELAGQQAEFRVRRISSAGERGPSTVIAPISATRSSGYPRMSSAGGELLFAWTATGEGASRVMTGGISLPGSRNP
jgi:hypothetical protein